MIVPTRWGFKRTSMLPILTVFGESNIEGIDSEMIHISLKILKKTEKFKGRPYEKFIPVDSNFPLLISFSVIFPSENELNEFIGEAQKGKLF